jgi:hypothetical protein
LQNWVKYFRTQPEQLNEPKQIKEEEEPVEKRIKIESDEHMG